MSKKNILVLLCKATLFCSVAFSYSQSSEINQFEKAVKNNEYNNAILLSKKIDKKKCKAADKAKFDYLFGTLEEENNKDNLAFNDYIIAKKEYIAIDSIDKVAQINLKIVALLLAINKNKEDYDPFLNEYIEYAKLKKDPNFLSQSYMEIGKSFYNADPFLALYYFKKAEKENLKTSNEVFLGKILQNLGATYAHDKIKKFDSAIFVYDKALLIFKKRNLQNFIFNIYTNKGVAFNKKKEFNKALLFFQKADSIQLKEYNQKSKEILYGFMADTYKNVLNFKKALECIEWQKKLQNTINEKEQSIAIKEIQTKYETQKKELENLNLKTKNEHEMLWIYIFISLIIAGSTVAYLKVNNLRKKEKIAIQEKELQNERLEKALKDHELESIESMLQGQEKERIKIANDLHDNLGSMLVTLKLNFQNIKERRDTIKTEEDRLYEKTDSLLEEAYQKVRTIAHTKNAGVIANDGLVPAVKNIADKISLPGKLNVEVIAFGLDTRLENTLEVSIFRMIQEILTNIIKHSSANKATIQLTKHDDSLNIIIEDNGIGFNPSRIDEMEGMGLNNIKKKVQYMNGTFTIDSFEGKGTTIIIDLPI